MFFKLYVSTLLLAVINWVLHIFKTIYKQFSSYCTYALWDNLNLLEAQFFNELSYSTTHTQLCLTISIGNERYFKYFRVVGEFIWIYWIFQVLVMPYRLGLITGKYLLICQFYLRGFLGVFMFNIRNSVNQGFWKWTFIPTAEIFLKICLPTLNQP